MNEIDILVSRNKEYVASMETIIHQYISQLTSLMDTYPLVMHLLTSNVITSVNDVNDFIKTNGIEILEDDDKTSIKMSHSIAREFKHKTERVHKSTQSLFLFPVNIVVSMVSLYDAYLGGIIKEMYIMRPEILNECEKNISLKDLLQYSSIEDAKERIIEKEVETIIRDSHTKQIGWLEKKLNIPLTKNLPSYKDFVEITERRNLFVHTNGKVSRQYIAVCNEYGVSLGNIKIGDILSAEPNYVAKCYDVLFEIGVKLAHVIWRKLKEEDRQKADDNLNSICFDLIKEGKYHLAQVLLEFATTTLKKYGNEEYKNIFIVNNALAYYLDGKKEQCKQIINACDWSASAAKFQLAVAVLNEDFAMAASKMKGAQIEVTPMEYKDWPLFKVFIETEEFKNEYNTLFGEDFIYKEQKGIKLEDVYSLALGLQRALKVPTEKTSMTVDELMELVQTTATE